jgi:hypothetical protein
MEPTVRRWLPVQSPPVSRGLPRHQGHQHSGGIEAAACNSLGIGICHYPNGPGPATMSCQTCCAGGGVSWDNLADGSTERCPAPAAG